MTPEANVDPLVPPLGPFSGRVAFHAGNVTGVYGFRTQLTALDEGACRVVLGAMGTMERPGIKAFIVSPASDGSFTQTWIASGGWTAARISAAGEEVRQELETATTWAGQTDLLWILEAGETRTLLFAAQDLDPSTTPDGIKDISMDGSSFSVGFDCEMDATLLGMDRVTDFMPFWHGDMEGPALVQLGGLGTTSLMVDGRIGMDVSAPLGIITVDVCGDLLSVHGGAGILELRSPTRQATYVDTPRSALASDIVDFCWETSLDGPEGTYELIETHADALFMSSTTGMIAGYGPWPADEPWPRAVLEPPTDET